MEMEEDVDDPMELDDTVPNSTIIESSTSDIDTPASVSNTLTNQEEPINIDGVTSTEKPISENIETNYNIENSMEVVVLDDEDDEPILKKKKNKAAENLEVQEFVNLISDKVGGACVNYECKSGKDMMEAPEFCLSYFRVKSSSKKTKKVCMECYNIAVKMYDSLVEEINSGHILTDVKTPLINVMVEIEDSDDEDESPSEPEYLDGESFLFVENNIDNVVNEIFSKFNIDDQVDKETAAIKARIQKAKSNLTELRTNLDSMRSKADKIQIDFYNEFRPTVKSVGTVSIIDDPMAKESLINGMSTPGKKMVLTSATSPRVVPKPIFNVTSLKPTVSSPTVPIIIPAVAQKIQSPPPKIPPVAQKIYPPAPPKVLLPVQKMQVPVQVAPPAPSRKSLRTANKLISYAEMDEGISSPIPKDKDSSPDDDKVDKYPKEEEKMEEVTIPEDFPPVGAVIKPPLEPNEIYYISREGNPSGSWLRARLTDILVNGGVLDGRHVAPLYKFVELKKQRERLVTGKNVAYFTSAKVRLEVGARVIAEFKDLSDEPGFPRPRTNPFYSGVVGEPPYYSNKYRYLIFFDIGYSQYVDHTSVHLIFEVSKNVWEDTPTDSRNFIKKHINSSDWPMVKLERQQTLLVEYQGKWLLCAVLDVDCSMMQVCFEDLNRVEWVYRGSRRIREIFREEQASSKGYGAHMASRKIGPSDRMNIVQYTPNVNFKSTTVVIDAEEPDKPSRAVARKSTTKPHNTTVASSAVPFLPAAAGKDDSLAQPGPISKIMYFTPRDQLVVKRPFRPHACNKDCGGFLTHNFNKLHGQNPLSKPLLCGWVRMTIKVRGRKDILYKAPCGRILRNIAEIHAYLSTTLSDMTVDLFDFNQIVRCLAEFSVDCDPDPKDLSRGLELVPLPVVNGLNNEILDFWNYTTRRIPTEDVNMNLDPDFLVCCDCENDCIDKTICACWKLTLEGSLYFDKDLDLNSVGYIYRRLHEQVVTGIYECNSRCKCRSTCLNRVVQNPMSLKLQVFKTHNKGWGIRALNDVPQGSFLCIYAGTMHTDQKANENGKNCGDEYFAELDYIESVEKFKEDYEKECKLEEEDMIGAKAPPSPVAEEVERQRTMRSAAGRGRRPNYNVDRDFVTQTALASDSGIQTRLRRRNPTENKPPERKQMTQNKRDPPLTVQIKKEIIHQVSQLTNEMDTVTISDDEDVEREVLSFNPQKGAEFDEEKSTYNSVRDLYGRDESIYIMDAKNIGNIGRFLNHSCSPNVFVQNVFVDTHDPRFPWVAFFSSQFIRAGSELTWNYSYDVGSVPDKVLYCACASPECKGRLL